jgi:hypothetical protein
MTIKSSKIAPDGEPYDTVYRNIQGPMPEEIEVIQLIHPNAKRQPTFLDVGKEYVAKVKQLNLVFYAELDSNNMVILWGKQMDTNEEKIEIATNGPSDKAPIIMMKKLIDSF